MACVATGKIKEAKGLLEALEIVRSKPDVQQGMLRIISQEASGRIGLRSGRFIIGAHIGATGLSGYPALKTFLTLKRGMFYYLEGEEAGGMSDLEQALGVDLNVLLAGADEQGDLMQCFSDLAQENGWDCVTEVFTNATPSTTMPAYSPGQGQQAFGETFLDKIAWAAKTTWQRLSTLGRRVDPVSDQTAAKVFQDLENALSGKTPAESYPTATVEAHVSEAQVQAVPPRPFSMPPRDKAEREKAFAERTSDSAKLRQIDLDEVVEKADAPAAVQLRKQSKKVDFASVGLMALTIGFVALGILGYRTISFMTSGEENVQRAQKYLNDGKNDLAANELTLALAKKPNDVPLLLMRAAAYEAGGDYQRALQDFEAVRSHDPNNREANLHSAIILCRLCQFNDSLPITEAMMRKDPKDANAIGLHAVALAGTNRSDAALKYLDQIKDDSGLAPNLVASVNGARGFVLLSTHRAKEALPYYAKALQQQSGNDGLHRETAQCYIQLGETDKALAELKEAVHLAPSAVWNYVELAKLYEGKNDLPQAINSYREAIKLERHPLDLYLKVAALQLKMGRYGDALESCNAVNRLSPDNKEAEKIRLVVLTKEKSAKPLVVGLADLKPEKADQNSGLMKGYKALEAGKFAEAVKLLSAAATEDPQDTNVHHLLAVALQRSGNKPAAYVEYAWLADNNALPVSDRLQFADIAADTNHPEKALTVLGDCLEQQPNWVEARLKMIRICAASGLAERASTVAQEGVLRAKSPEEKKAYQDALASGGHRSQP